MKPLPAGVAVAAGLVALATVPAIASSSADPTPAAPATVSMEAVLRAAQIDPQRHDQKVISGAGPSVTAVERALRARGLLEQQYVDGHFGTKTVSAYAAYQRSLGYEGLAANGLPGRSSLVRLGADRFDVTHVVRPGARTTHTGKVVNERTKAMLRQAQRLAGRTFELDQGSYNPGGDPTSAGTHDGGGVVDINVDSMNRAQRTKAVKALRQVGFAAWYRTPSQDDWPYHIHAVAINDPDLSSPAQHQVGDYYLGRNGLANEAPDDGPEVKPIRTWEQYQQTR
ncbi:peptidoglycan hydrolase-like protein with peptidoglycan-binding domain [Saccharomonospora amisosensis]|uniref:Peptidoglycan hydrolase-like protein with peptidoglycan-binding domain n=1 Tax=Saccharomonospora amisosensis TaxID=1128677 RepID=A0A7X5USZ4_9PSEU|nr:peptidoglycan-binding protein [Saccharomonospora amisosensis]NIJ13327.1 peptidoglycan hydrolase-like protein with peptidoglycan-binding domain [Saccharomonospora amisosensis]